MDNMQKFVRKQQINRAVIAVSALVPEKLEPLTKRSPEIVEEAFRVFTHQASQAGSDSKFLEELRKLTGHDSVEAMVKRFQKLAGIC
jgi:hypothetical protein